MSGRLAMRRRGLAGTGTRLGAVLVVAAVLLLSGPPRPALSGADDAQRPIRIGFSAAFFGDANAGDASAAVRTWEEAILRRAGVPFDPQPLVCQDTAEIARAVAEGAVDAVALRFPEFAAIPAGLLEDDAIYISQSGPQVGDAYVIVVHRDAGIQALSDLCGRRLLCWDAPRTCLAQPWLEVQFRANGLAPGERLPLALTMEQKLAKVVLPVFFRQVDACLVTKDGLESMAELNPQVGQQLQILASSPRLVGSFFCFRRGYSSAYRPQIEQSIREMHTSVAGRQVLTIFGVERITPQPASCLQSARELMAAYRKLGGDATAQARDAAPGAPLKAGMP